MKTPPTKFILIALAAVAAMLAVWFLNGCAVRDLVNAIRETDASYRESVKAEGTRSTSNVQRPTFNEGHPDTKRKDDPEHGPSFGPAR